MPYENIKQKLGYNFDIFIVFYVGTYFTCADEIYEILDLLDSIKNSCKVLSCFHKLQSLKKY